MSTYEYMLLADGSVITFPDGTTSAWQISDTLIRHKGVAYYWSVDETYPSAGKSWYVLLPVFEYVGGTTIAYERIPDVIKLALILS